MKKFSFFLILLVATQVAVFAQEIPSRKDDGYKPQTREKIGDKKQFANLNLTDDQKAKMKSINKDTREQMEAIQKDDQLSKEAAQDKMAAIRKDREEKIQAVLTDDQKAQLQKAKDNAAAKGADAGKKHDARLQQQLNLSDDQRAKLAESRKANMEKIQAIRNDASLTDDQKKEQIKDLMKAQKANMKSVLTDEQREKMKEMKKDKMKGKKGTGDDAPEKTTPDATR